METMERSSSVAVAWKRSATKLFYKHWTNFGTSTACAAVTVARRWKGSAFFVKETFTASLIFTSKRSD